MCSECWNEYGKPTIDTPAVRAAAAAVREVYEHHVTGGNLHIVVDDWNVEDENLAWCRQCIDGGGVMPGAVDDDAHRRYNDEKRAHPDPPDQLAAERRCCDLLAALTEEERCAALALHDGLWGQGEGKPL